MYSGTQFEKYEVLKIHFSIFLVLFPANNKTILFVKVHSIRKGTRLHH